MNRLLLRQILANQKADILSQSSDSFIEREINLEEHLSGPEIIIVTGVRRCGKSSILEKLLCNSQIIDQAIYINFEDPQLADFTSTDFLEVYKSWLEENGPTAVKVAFFDEIQNVTGWETWMNFFAKQKKFKVFISGSNSKLLSSELATHLTGRYKEINLFPLSFGEVFKDYQKRTHSSIDTQKTLTIEDKAGLQKLTKNYLSYGGFPRVWQSKDASLLVDYYQSILNRDIVKRKKIRNPLLLEKLGSLLFSDVGRKINKRKIADNLGLKDAETVDKYIKYFEECFLGIQIRKYDDSLRKQLRNQPKFYAVDSALPIKIGFSNESKYGFYLENLVALELLRRGGKIYYWELEQKGEIDFVVETKDRQIELVQVAWSLEEEKTLARELNSFKMFEEKYQHIKISKKILITMVQIELGSIHLPRNIVTEPFYLWALGGGN